MGVTEPGAYDFYIACAGTGQEPGGVVVLAPDSGRIRTSKKLVGNWRLAARPDGTGTQLYALTGDGRMIETVATQNLETDILFQEHEEEWGGHTIVLAVAVNDDGSRLLVLQQGVGVQGVVAEVDTASGTYARHPIPQEPVSGFWRTLAVSPDGRHAYLGRPAQHSNEHHLSTAFSDTPKTAATSSRSRPATNAATARSRRASCADGDRCRASPTRSLTPHQRPKTQTVSDQYVTTTELRLDGVVVAGWIVRQDASGDGGGNPPDRAGRRTGTGQFVRFGEG
ncbi:hypothetical protein [Streptomyces violascens]|uniref:hypothetical protein n=1 Tax=Streptomyces violascens TaxID=67381 RepID=UPI003697FB44